jgi:hypothetical protein
VDILIANKSMACGGHNVICHIIDTGVNAVGELAGCVKLVAYIPSPDSALDIGPDYTDRHGHGTMMASVLHRQAPHAMIYSYSVYVRGGDVNKALARIIDEVNAAPNKRHTVSMSMSTGEGPETSYYTEMRLLIEQLNALGVPFVCSAGNDGEEALGKWPACFQAPITVTALQRNGERAHFSSWTDEADFGELGIDVPCMDMYGQETKCSGTSPATQIVAGKLARILSENPALTEAQLYEAAKANALDLGATGHDPYFGWGWISSIDIDAYDNTGGTPPETEDNSMDTLRLTTPYTRGEAVKTCQRRLVVHGFAVTIDGVYGPNTQAAVLVFQRANNLTADGIVGSKTWAKLDASPGDAEIALPVRRIEGMTKRMTRSGDYYIIGAQNHRLTKEYLTARVKAKPGYFNAKRIEWLESEIEAADEMGREIYCEDCSGLLMACNDILHFWPDKDLTANGIYERCKKISRSDVGPGDVLFRVEEGEAVHMAYVGYDGVYEAVGTEFGVVCRTDIDDRMTFNRMTGKMEKRPAWTHYGRPQA